MGLLREPETDAQRALNKTGIVYRHYGDGDTEAFIDTHNGQAHLLAEGGVHGVTIRPDGSMEPALLEGGFTDHEHGVLMGVVRDHIRRTIRKREAAARKFGEAFDPSRHDERIEALRRVYAKLGGDPDRIDNMPEVV